MDTTVTGVVVYEGEDETEVGGLAMMKLPEVGQRSRAVGVAVQDENGRGAQVGQGLPEGTGGPQRRMLERIRQAQPGVRRAKGRADLIGAVAGQEGDIADTRLGHLLQQVSQVRPAMDGSE